MSRCLSIIQGCQLSFILLLVSRTLRKQCLQHCNVSVASGIEECGFPFTIWDIHCCAVVQQQFHHVFMTTPSSQHQCSGLVGPACVDVFGIVVSFCMTQQNL